MAIESVAGAALKPAVNEVTKKTIGSIFEFLAKKYELVEILKFKNKYLKYCENVLQVKTLVSHDKVFHVDDIYVPIHLMQAGTQTRIEIDNQTALDNDRALLIKGLAGQGKSTLLRKLLSNNAKRFSRLPIFYELKNYKGGSIEVAISNSLNNSGVKLGEYALKKILSDSNVKLYLDAFDEVKPEYRTELLDEIRRLINSFNCHVVCTSRPDTEIRTLSELETYYVCELTEQQIFGIIENVASDSDKSDELCEALKRSPLHDNKDSILKSPILVVLFCISYNLGEEIPSTLSQFYSNIFDTVFHRHDNMKGKVHRQRHWNDNRRIYKELFNCLCFISLQESFNSFNKEKLLDFITTSLEYVDEDTSLADKVATELSSITNLIIEDGFNEYRYVHKSIQEFFAASFVMSLHHDKKVSFYRKCFKDHKFYSLFHNTLFFLEELDYYDFHEYGFIPAVCSIFSLPKNQVITEIVLPSDMVDIFLDEIKVQIEITLFKNKKRESFHMDVSKLIFEGSSKYPQLYSTLFGLSVDFIKFDLTEKDLLKMIRVEGESLKNGRHELSLRALMKEKNISVEYAIDALEIGFNVLIRRKYNNAIEKVNNRSDSLSKSGYFDF